MIVDPDFPDHWKTRMLVDALDGDEAAPVYLLRLWAHCQNRRTAAFDNLPQTALKALCRFPGHSNKLESSLAASGFVRREDQTLIVVGWEEYNASLIANWSNGRKGGRPKITHGLSTGIPSETHGEPIRVDRIGKDNTPLTPQGGQEPPDLFDQPQAPEPTPPATPEDSPPPAKDRILPPNWQRIPERDRKRSRVLRNSEAMVRIGKFFNRQATNLWTVAEAAALFQIKPTPEEVKDLELYYRAVIPKDHDYRRHDLATLLNNWSTELDRAKVYQANK